MSIDSIQNPSIPTKPDDSPLFDHHDAVSDDDIIDLTLTAEEDDRNALSEISHPPNDITSNCYADEGEPFLETPSSTVSNNNSNVSTNLAVVSNSQEEDKNIQYLLVMTIITINVTEVMLVVYQEFNGSFINQALQESEEFLFEAAL